MGLLSLVEFHVTSLLRNALPTGFHFHDLQHTRDVVAAVGDIAISEDLSPEEWEDLMVAGWFHDTGFMVSPATHEIESINMARRFLSEQTPLVHFRIERISKIIAATQIDFPPRSLLEQIIKDADTYHLSKPNYPHYLNKLREEWFEILGKDIPEDQWLQLNLDFLKQHNYYTQYGKKKLAKRKRLNIRMLEFKLIDALIINQ